MPTPTLYNKNRDEARFATGSYGERVQDWVAQDRLVTRIRIFGMVLVPSMAFMAIALVVFEAVRRAV